MTEFESTAEFEVDSNGVLVQYNGRDGDINMPNRVRVIGKRTFEGSDLRSAVVPDKLKYIFSDYDCQFVTTSQLEQEKMRYQEQERMRQHKHRIPPHF